LLEAARLRPSAHLGSLMKLSASSLRDDTVFIFVLPRCHHESTLITPG
jgi:hypothetical protein